MREAEYASGTLGTTAIANWKFAILGICFLMERKENAALKEPALPALKSATYLSSAFFFTYVC